MHKISKHISLEKCFKMFTEILSNMLSDKDPDQPAKAHNLIKIFAVKYQLYLMIL